MIEVYTKQLRGLILDWAVGHAAGYKLKITKAGETTSHGRKWNKSHIFRYVDGGLTDSGIKKLPVLEIFKPTEDWEHLPESVNETFEDVYYGFLQL